MTAQESHPDGESDQTDGDDQEDAHEPVELALERRPPMLPRSQAPGDATELGPRARGHDHAFAPTSDDARSGVCDRMAAGKGRVVGVHLDPAFLGQ